MQYRSETMRPQLSLFEGMMAQRAMPFCAAPASVELRPEYLSELSLSGNSEHCHLLLTPILRDLSEADDKRWLTLIAPPGSLSGNWLRDSGLNRQRVIVLHPRNDQSALELACKALGSGCSHTVITWQEKLSNAERNKLRAAASLGQAKGLNIRLGC